MEKRPYSCYPRIRERLERSFLHGRVPLNSFLFSVLAIPHLTFWSMEAPQVAADDASNRSPYSVWCYGNRLQVTAAMTAMDDPPSMFPMIHVWFSLDLEEQVLALSR